MDGGFSFATFLGVLATILLIIVAVMIILAPLKLWAMDKTLKEILEELKKLNRK